VILGSPDQPARIAVVFDELVDPSTIQNNSLILRKQGSAHDIPIEIEAIGHPEGNTSQTQVVWRTILPADPTDLENRVVGATTYTATLSQNVEDLAGNSLDPAAVRTWSFTTHPDFLGDSQAHEFSAVTVPACMVLLRGPELGQGVLAGDVVLKGSRWEDFDGSALSADWVTAAGSPTLGGSVLRVDGASVTGTGHGLTAGSSAFFFAILSGQTGQRIGLVQNTDPANPGAMAALVVEPGGLVAVTRTSTGTELRSAPQDFASGGNRFAIRWLNDRVIYEVFFNGGERVEIANHALAVGGTLYPSITDPAVASAIQVPWISMMSTGSATSCTYTSRVRESWYHYRGFLADWTELFWMGTRSGISFQTRSGNTPSPDGSWSNWATVNTTNRIVTSPQGHYIQYRLTMEPNGVEPRWIENLWIEYLKGDPAPIPALPFWYYMPLMQR
jgi:hypothetical protein